MGYLTGTFLGRGSEQKYSMDSFRIGRCNVGDEWESCSGGCNDYQVGGACSEGPKCDKNQGVKITINCKGGNSIKTISCAGAELALADFESMGKGYCPNGYYKGWGYDADQNEMDAEKCAKHCKSEPECKYFAVNPKKTCSRYNDQAGECPSNNIQDHDLYKKKV